MTVRYLKRGQAQDITDAFEHTVRDTVAQIIEDVQTRGDEAVRDWSVKFDGWAPELF